MARREFQRSSDEELLVAIAAASEPAFDEFYRRHASFINALCEHRARSTWEAAEASAGVFLAIWRRADTFDAARGSALSWVTGIARYQILDHHRAESRRVALLQRLFCWRAADRENEIDLTIDGVDAQRWTEAIIRAIDELPSDQRCAVRLMVFEGMSSGEAAAVLGTTPTAARMRLSRARRSLSHLRPLLGTAA